MRSRLLTLLILGLAAWALLHFAQQQDAALPPARQGGPLFPGLELDSVTRFGLETRGDAGGNDWVEFERDPPGPWHIVFPAPELAEQEFVDAALRQIADAKALAVERQGIELDPAELGLDPPRFRLKVYVGEQELVLFLGERDALGKGVFARRGDSDEVFMVSPGLLTASEQFRPYDYVDKSLFRGHSSRIVGITVKDAERVWLDAEREGQGWRVDAPRPGRGDAGRLDAVVNALQFIDQRSVHATDPGLATLRSVALPSAEERERGELSRSTLVELRPEGEPPLRVYLAENWRESDPVWALRDDGHKLLGLEPQDLSPIWNADKRSFLDPDLFPPLRERASSVSLHRGDEPLFDLRRGPRGDWIFRSPERLAGEAVDSRVVDGRSNLNDLLQSLDSLQAVDFMEPPEGEPALVLRVAWEAGGRTLRDRLELFDVDAAAGPIPARLESRPGEGLAVERAVLELLDPFLPDRLRTLTPDTSAAADWRTQQIRLPGLDDALALRRELDAQGRARVTGDDPEGRRLGLGHDVLGGLRGLGWAPRPEPAPEYPWALRWLDAERRELASLQLRRPSLQEPQKALGLPVVRALWSGVPDAELLLPADVLERFEELRAGAGD